MITKEIEELKEKGNVLYKSSRFEQAEEIYSCALEKYEASPQDQDRHHIRLNAALLSNRGNARFEQGKYRDSAMDSHKAIAILQQENASCPAASESAKVDDVTDSATASATATGVSPNDALISKNHWRLMRCLFYTNSPDLLKYVETIEDDMLKNKAAPLIEAVQYDASIKKLSSDDSPQRTGVAFSPQVLRSNVSSPYCEYYPFGHDKAQSAVSDIDVKMQTQIDVLYGGVGDGRHVFATILDFYSRSRDSDPTDVNLRITMNDINKQVLLKDILVLILAKRVAPLAPKCLASLKEDQEAALLVLVLYYTTLGYAMPNTVYEKLQALVREIFLDDSFDAFQEKYPWLSLSECDWHEIQRVAEFWVDTSKYDPPPGSVKMLLNFYSPQDPFKDALDDLESLEGLGLPDEKIAEMKEMFAESAAKKKAQIEEIKKKYSDRSTWSPDFETMIREEAPEGCSDEELVEFALKVIEENVPAGGPEKSLDDKKALHSDKFVTHLTHALRVPNIPCIKDLKEDMDKMSKLAKLSKTDSKDKSELHEAVLKSKEHIYTHWKMNPAKIDPDWLNYNGNYIIGGTPDKDNPTFEFPDYFFHKDVTDTFTIGPTSYVGVLYQASLFQIFAIFYINLGRAIDNLVKDKSLAIEISLRSILDFEEHVLASRDIREKVGLPSKYNEIFLSNVPDYTGLLSVFVKVAPLLQPGSQSTIRSNVLKNTGMFSNFDQYIFGTTALCGNGVARILRMRLLEENPSCWNDFNKWGWDIIDEKRSPVTLLEFNTWLYRLFLMTAAPAFRDSASYVNEEQPNTIGLFLLVCKYCINELGYPSHWVMTTLDALLQSKPLLTKAKPANTSPSSMPLEKKRNSYNITAFQAELRNQLAIYIQNGLLPATMTFSKKLPIERAVLYSIKIQGIDVYTCGGKPTISCLGFLLEKKKNTKYESQNMMLDAFLARMTNQGGLNRECHLRDDLLSKGKDVGHLFSCAQYNAKLHSLSFYMCTDMFKEFNNYHLTIVRTDSWKGVNHNPVRLRDAETKKN